MRSKKATGILLLLVVILVVSVFTAAIPGIASESPDTTVTAEPTEEIGIEELQQSVYDRGYNYAVRKNWITALSPEKRQNLCGYKSLMPPTGPLPENINFRSMVEIPKSEKVGLPPVGQTQAYDAMALGYVTPVKNQSTCGSCWLFGAIADFESDVLINESQELNFSEQEVGDCNIWSSVGGHDFCEGGVELMTTNYFTKYGVADEACHPYAAAPQTCQNCPLLKNVDNWRMITGDDGESQISTIKNAILNYGPVQSSIYASDPGFKAYDSGVYEYWGPEELDHAIAIIGWNDSLPHSHGTGAWLIKNSWGTSWGASGPYPGCAWVAYGAANLGDDTSAIASYKNPDDLLFYHDECGWVWYCTGCDDPTAYGAVRFIPSQDNMNLTAVDFWAVDANMEYEIKIFDTLNDLGGGKYTFSDQHGTNQTGTTNEFGYYSIPLDTPVQLVSGNDFIVQVNLTTTGYGYPIPIDYAEDISWLNWAAIATSSGESYKSCDGSQFVKYGEGGIDIGIRARAGVEVTQPDIWVSPQSFEKELSPDEVHSENLTIGNHGTDALNFEIQIDYVEQQTWMAEKSTQEVGWLSVSPTTGTVSPDDQTNINVTFNTTGLPVGEYNANISITSNDTDEIVITVPVHLVVRPVFDTGAPENPYPSISGTHKGTITPNQTIKVSKMYTYPCSGTGGHSEYVAFYTDTAGTGSVLIIDNDNNPYFGDDQSVDIFNKTFTEIGYNVTIEESVKTLNSTWSNYDIIVWSSGDDLTPLRHETLLFSIIEGAQEVEDDLNNGTISEILKEKFETKGFPISEDAMVTIKTDEHWVITDGERIYYVKKEGIGLTIYRYSEDKNKLVDYVTDGGHLILEGGNIAWECRAFTEFATKVLHIPNKFVYSDVGDLTLSRQQHPIATTPNVLPENISFIPDKPGDDSGDADAVMILPDATGVYNWSYVNYMGTPVPESVAHISYGLIAYDNDVDVTNGGQIIYYAFDIDDIDDPDIQRELIENTENWLRVVKGAEIATGTWTGYQGADDYYYIVFVESFMLEKDVTYNYTIRTGSYPQIHHRDALSTANGWINCTEFRDANGKEYTGWIPAIRLE